MIEFHEKDKDYLQLYKIGDIHCFILLFVSVLL